MIFHYTLLEKEYLAIDGFVQARLLRDSRLLQRAGFLNTVIWVSLAIAFGFTIRLTGGETTQTELAIQVLILFVIIGSIALKFLQAAAYRALIVDGSHLLNQPWKLVANEDGVNFSSTNFNVAMRWSGVDSVVEMEGAVCVFFNKVAYMPIAASAFISQAAREEFIQFASLQLSARKEKST